MHCILLLSKQAFFKHLPQMYLLVEWYTVYMGVDREKGVFVSLYGPGVAMAATSPR